MTASDSDCSATSWLRKEPTLEWSKQYLANLLRMSRKQPMKVFEHGLIHWILLGLILNALDGVLCKDEKELAIIALDPAADVEGVWHLQGSIFPRTNTYELLPMTFTPTCRDEDGVVTEARYPIPYEYARQPHAKLSIHCPIESPRRITHISINCQDYVAVQDPYAEHERRVDYVRLDQMANSTAANTPPPLNPPSPSPVLNPPPPKLAENPPPQVPATYPLPSNSVGNPPPSIPVATPLKSPPAASPPKSPPATIPPDGSV